MTTKKKPLQKYIAYYLFTAYVHINTLMTLNRELFMHRVTLFGHDDIFNTIIPSWRVSAFVVPAYRL